MIYNTYEKYVTMSSKKLYYCTELLDTGKPCTYVSDRSDVFKIHLRFTHKIGVVWYNCPEDGCEYKSMDKGNLQNHIQNRHREPVYYECPIEGCSALIKQKSNIKQHLITHGINVKWFYCEEDDECKLDDVKFNKKGNYERHLARKHRIGNYREFRCPECDVILSTKAIVKSHLADVHGINAKWHHCQEEGCEYKTTRNPNLTRHIKTHSEEYRARQKSKEEKLYNYLVKCFGRNNIKREHQITFRCLNSTFCRIDYMLIKDGRVFLIECDEYQHDEHSTNYTVGCETRRMYDAYASLKMEGNTLPVHFIRFNPDYYKVDNMPSPVKLRDRYTYLYQFIQNFDVSQEFSIHYLFYTTEDSMPIILDHWEYNEEVRQYVIY